jgi:phospholipid-binding lipoprotein MlaA
LTLAPFLPALLLNAATMAEQAPVAPVAPPPVVATLPAPDNGVAGEDAGQAAPPPSAAAAQPAAAPSDIQVTLPDRPTGDAVRDPLEGFNRGMFGVYKFGDRVFLRPVAMAYKHVVPKPARDGVRNVLGNLTEPVAFLNDVLQLKFGKAVRTLARFTVNSTAGIGGLFDVAKQPNVNLPRRPNGFGDTLAFYGVRSGPYLFVPFIGPTTLRDVFGSAANGIVLPYAVGNPFDTWQYQLSTGGVSGVDERAEKDAELRSLLGSAVDPYATLRSVYLQNRAAEVEALKGHGAKPAGAAPELDDPLSDPGATEQPSTAPEPEDPLADPAAPPPSGEA